MSQSLKKIKNFFSTKNHPHSQNGNIPTVEIRMPISANEKYLRMVHYFLESLQQFGGPMGRSAKCVFSVSRDEPYRDLLEEYPWTSKYDVEFLWIDEELFKKYSYHGTVFHRFKVKSNADIVILADADIFVAGNFDQSIYEAFKYQKLLGFIAHVSPFRNTKYKNSPSESTWKIFFKKAGLSCPPIKNIHTGWGLMNNEQNLRKCPFYYNYGFIVSPRKFVEQMGLSFLSEIDTVDELIETHFKSQIANTLCFQRHNIPCGTLSINYNFPLHVHYDKIRSLNPDPLGANDANDVKIFHYLGDGQFSRNDFRTVESLEAALKRRNLNKGERIFQQKLLLVHEKLNKK